MGSLWKGKLLGFRSEVTINLTRPLKKMQASEFFPLLYYIVFFSDAPSPGDLNWDKKTRITYLNQEKAGITDLNLKKQERKNIKKTRMTDSNQEKARMTDLKRGKTRMNYLNQGKNQE